MDMPFPRALVVIALSPGAFTCILTSLSPHPYSMWSINFQEGTRMSPTQPQPQTHAAFEWVRSAPIHALNLELQEFRHKVTGAPHIHLASDDDQNAFMVAFRTVPMDSTGV